MTFLLDVKLAREGQLILINGNQASVAFKKTNKDKTFEAVIDKCCDFDKGFQDPKELEYLKQSVELQLTSIYQEYEKGKQKPAATAKNPVEQIKKQDIPFEDWQKGITERLGRLRAVTERNFPQVWPSVEFVLAVSRILYVKDITLPFMGIILGKPSSSKTLAIECFRGSPHTFYTDAFTPRAFVSHNSGMTEEQLREIDLLPKIRDSIFLTPELAPVFTAKEEEITSLFGMITRILDGHGYESDTGAQGHRGYTGDYMFVWVGAVVEVPRKIFKILGTLGPKLYFFRLTTAEKSEDAYEQEMQDDNFAERRDEVKAVLVDYLEFFLGCPAMVESGRLSKIVWQKAQESREIRMIIVRLAKLLARLRGTIPTWDTGDSGGAQYAYALPTIEDPSRAMTQLRNLARGHALSKGRNHVAKEDLSILVNIALSTAPVERVAIFNLLLANSGKLKTSDIIRGLNTTHPTAQRTMVELSALGLVEMKKEEEKSNSEYQVTLKDEFSWFLEEEFQDLKEGVLKENYPPQQAENSPSLTDVKELNSAMGGGQNSFSAAGNMLKEKSPPHEEKVVVRCPYCSAAYETEEEVEAHSIRAHPGKAISAELAKKEPAY